MGASAAQLDSMEEELVKTLADAAKHINKNYDVEGLHSSFPDCMEKLRKRGGDRLTEHQAADRVFQGEQTTKKPMLCQNMVSQWAGGAAEYCQGS